MADDDEEGAFDIPTVKGHVNKACKALLMGPNDTPVPFQANKVGQWTSTLVENVLKELAEKNSEAAKNGQQKFKYVVTAHMQQRVGAAVVTACATYGDKALDLFTSVKYETEAVQVLVAVYGIAI